MRAVLQWLVVVWSAQSALSARILAVAPFPGKSHQLYVTSVLRALASSGHQVVQYSPFPSGEPILNITHVQMHIRFENKMDNWSFEDLKGISNYDENFFKVRVTWGFNYDVCEDTFKDKNIQKLLKSNEHFDLVMTESTFGEESLLIFGHKFGAPTITLEPMFPWSVIHRDAGNSLSIASMPELMPFAFTDQMTFKERLLNLIAVTSNLNYYYNKHIPRQEKILRRYYPVGPSVAELISNVSLYLSNNHPTAVNYIRPYTPNIVPIGGIHIVPDRLPLPEDVKQFMDGSTDGVIYFSLGTMVPIHRLPMEVLKKFINVFKKIPQRVLWKMNLKTLPPVSSNVMVRDWVPQLGVLDHPNCVLFITHGGLFSQQEAIHAGVPTVGIPFFADQTFNIRFNEHRGIGVRLDIFTMTEDSLYGTLTSVLNNPRYKENAQALSRVYRDQPLSPAQTTVFWVEYVLRHRGAHHLRPVSASLPWYKLALLDVAAVIVTAFFLSLFVLGFSCKKLFSFVYKDRGRVTNKKVN